MHAKFWLEGLMRSNHMRDMGTDGAHGNVKRIKM
jgi:hypothetical protein